MPTNSILPLKTGAGPSFPLSPHPHMSRVEDEITTDSLIGSPNPKNYQFVAFRPGWPLQASELNEIQEHYQLQLTLTIAMMNNWITSGAGPMWRDGIATQPGDGGDFTGTAPPVSTGIGVGGQNAPNGGHVQEYAISGPGWRGATPLHPFVNPYSGHGNNFANQVEVEYLASGNNLKITFNPGWWCVELPKKNPASENTDQYISGLKHWIYIDESIQVLPTIPMPINNPLDIEIPVGLVMQTLYYDCCDESNDPLEHCDPDLGDNSGDFTNDVGCGASRYAVNAIGAATVNTENWPPVSGGAWNNGQDEYDKLSLVCKINPFRRTVRYMNNIILFTW